MLSEHQKQTEVLYDFNIKVIKMKVIRDAHDGSYKRGDVVTIKSFGSMVSWDENGKWYSFYDLKRI